MAKKAKKTDEEPKPEEPLSGVAGVVAALSSLTLEELDAQIVALQDEMAEAKQACAATIAAAIAAVKDPAEKTRDAVVSRVRNELAAIREVRKLVDVRINGKKKPGPKKKKAKGPAAGRYIPPARSTDPPPNAVSQPRGPNAARTWADRAAAHVEANGPKSAARLARAVGMQHAHRMEGYLINDDRFHQVEGTDEFALAGMR